MTKRFQRAMWLMRRHDPQAMEDGFGLLLPHAADHLDELIAEFAQERNDHGLRCWLLELIGEARSPQALPVLSTMQRTQRLILQRRVHEIIAYVAPAGA